MGREGRRLYLEANGDRAKGSRPSLGKEGVSGQWWLGVAKPAGVSWGPQLGERWCGSSAARGGRRARRERRRGRCGEEGLGGGKPRGQRGWETAGGGRIGGR
jgi:hypothetical protein